jgi:hypothetical protein
MHVHEVRTVDSLHALLLVSVPGQVLFPCTAKNRNKITLTDSTQISAENYFM